MSVRKLQAEFNTFYYFTFTCFRWFPVSGKWKLVDDYIDYIHSSARFYELGEEGVYKVIHYSEAIKIPEQGFSAESSAERLF